MRNAGNVLGRVTLKRLTSMTDRTPGEIDLSRVVMLEIGVSTHRQMLRNQIGAALIQNTANGSSARRRANC